VHIAPETKAWIFAGVLVLAGGWIVAMNLWIVHRRLRGRREHHSFTPLLGGGLCSAALLACPLPGAASFAWLPLVIDPGCAYSLLALLHAIVVRKAFRR
jgi:hypothetical protein